MVSSSWKGEVRAEKRRWKQVRDEGVRVLGSVLF
jgi:hypothetical protein